MLRLVAYGGRRFWESDRVHLFDDFVQQQPPDLKLSNALLQMGENAIISREVYDLKTAILDPTFTPQLLPVT